MLLSVCAIVVGLLLAALVYVGLKAVGYRRALRELRHQQAAYEQLDQQAKLIIRTDLELHRTQEELDRRLAALTSLHELGRRLQVTLSPEAVFAKLDAALVSNFGFTHGLLGMCESSERIVWRSCVGVPVQTADVLRAQMTASGLLHDILSDPAPRTFDAGSATTDQRALLEGLGVPVAIVAGVKPPTGSAGCLILACASTGMATVRADEGLVAILTHQLATAVENSALYQATHRSQQELERKVQERTRELAQANAELLRLNKAKSDFVSAVSHELRTPLAAIKGYASLLGSGQFGAVAKPQSERLGKIERHADLLTQLINNLLDIARIESGRTTMERRPIPVQDLLTIVQDMVRPQLEAKHIRYEVDVDGVQQLIGDPQHLRSVFLNLLSNAVKYTPDGGAIRVGFRQEPGALVATVSDTGCGMAPDELPKLFQEFYRTSDPINQQVRGTGLGLALVKRIVEAHRGEISVSSKKGAGSTFTIRLPVEP